MPVQGKLSKLETRTLDVLRKHAGSNRYCIVPVSLIAKELSTAERSVREAIRCLELAGLVNRRFSPGKQNLFELVAK